MLLSEIQIRDPFVLLHDGYYYLYGSTDKDIWKGEGTGFDAYRSRDLADWDGPIPVFRPPSGFWGTRNFWAPEVYEYKQAFYMLASFMGDGSICSRSIGDGSIGNRSIGDGSIGDRSMRGTAILKAENPEGPFRTWSDGAVTPRDWMCLDGTLYFDPNGEPWIVFCHEWVQVGDGEVCAAQLDSSLSYTVSEPIVLFTSKQAAWSHKAYSPSNQIEGYVTDGCFPYTLSNGKLLMLWSCIGKDGYCLGYAISDNGSITGPWRQAETPLFTSDGGHGMIFRDYNDRLLLTLHRPNKTPYERAVFIGLKETEDGLATQLP